MIYSLIYEAMGVLGISIVIVIYYKIFLSSRYNNGGIARDL